MNPRLDSKRSYNSIASNVHTLQLVSSPSSVSCWCGVMPRDTSVDRVMTPDSSRRKTTKRKQTERSVCVPATGTKNKSLPGYYIYFREGYVAITERWDQAPEHENCQNGLMNRCCEISEYSGQASDLSISATDTKN